MSTFIKGTTPADISEFSDSGLTAGTEYIFSADRCVFTPAAYDDTSKSYQIATAFFVGLNATGGTTTAGDFIPLTTPTIGFIGKSGRFVAYSE